MFDSAIFLYGRHVDSKMAEVDEKGKPKYKLKDVLRETSKESVSLLAMFDASGADVMDF